MEYSKPTGLVFIREFDRGIIESMGATVRLSPVDKKNKYFVDIIGAKPFTVPVIFNNPEQIFQADTLPCIHVSRDSFEPALMRWHSVGQCEYAAGVTGGVSGMVPGGIVNIGGVTGYQFVETKPQAWPYDIFYTISVFARFEHEAIALLRFVMRKFQPYSRVKVIDSLSETRFYSVYSEGPNDIGEVLDVADRTMGFSVNMRVEGELDLKDPVILPTLAGLEINTEPF